MWKIIGKTSSSQQNKTSKTSMANPVGGILSPLEIFSSSLWLSCLYKHGKRIKRKIKDYLFFLPFLLFRTRWSRSNEENYFSWDSSEEMYFLFVLLTKRLLLVLISFCTAALPADAEYLPSSFPTSSPSFDNSAMPKRKHPFFKEVFPKIKYQKSWNQKKELPKIKMYLKI